MAEKNLEKLLEKQTNEILRHQKMLLEEFNSRTKVLGEGIVGLNQKVDVISKKLDATMEMVASNTENIEFIKNSIKRKVDMEEFELLTKRVMILEKKLLPMK